MLVLRSRSAVVLKHIHAVLCGVLESLVFHCLQPVFVDSSRLVEQPEAFVPGNLVVVCEQLSPGYVTEHQVKASLGRFDFFLQRLNRLIVLFDKPHQVFFQLHVFVFLGLRLLPLFKDPDVPLF